MEHLVVELAAALRELRSSRCRGLVVVEGNARQLWDALTSTNGSVLCVAVRGDACSRVVGYSKLRELLGSEYDYVVLNLDEARASTIAAAGEMVVGGGALILYSERGLDSIGGRWGEYIRSKIRSAPVLVHVRRGSLVVSRLPKGKCELRSRSRRPRLRGRAGKVAELAATDEQMIVIEEALKLLRSPEAATLAVLGDRGRGKSAAVGLAIAAAVAARLLGTVAVTAPSLHSVQVLFKWLVRGLEAAGVHYKSWGVGELVEGVKGGYFKVQYFAPDEVFTAPLVVVDEAAAVGPARVRRIAQRARKLIVSTTIHGYEGSGKTLAMRLLEWLPKPRRVWLSTPIRYSPSDPLAAWLYDALLLDAEPPEPPKHGDVKIRLVEQDELLRNPKLLRWVYGLLSLAHYRSNPDDIHLLLDLPNTRVLVAERAGVPVGVAEARIPDELLARDILSMLGAGEARAARVVRIAVHPKLQRRGIGRRLLLEAEALAAESGCSLIVASFSNSEVVGFWRKCGYKVIRVSPRFNKMTGEKNIFVAKAVSGWGERLISRLACSFAQKLVLTLSSVYRDVLAEAAAEMLLSLEGACRSESTPLKLTEYQEHRLRQFLEGVVEAEEAMDSLLVVVGSAVLKGGLSRLNWEELLLVTAWVLQGKPIWDAAKVAGLSLEGARAKLREAVRKIIEGDHGG